MLKIKNNTAVRVLMIILGNLMYSAAVTLFVLPTGIICGGTTGLSLVFHHLLNVPVSAFVAVSNTIMFVIGWWVLGKAFALTTLISTFLFPTFLSVFERIGSLQNLTGDPLLSTLYAGAMIGIGIGLVFRCGASTGGLDIPPLVLNKKFGFNVSMMMYVIDTLILVAQLFFSDKEQVLYGILLVIIYTTVLNKTMLFGKSQIQVKIVSEKQDLIADRIINHLDRGLTLLHARTGYKGNETEMVLSVISPRELPRLKQMVSEIDPNAFVVISQVTEVSGMGFSVERVYPDTAGEE